MAKAQKKICINCGKEKRLSDFYASQNPMHGDNKLPYCKKCIKELSTDSQGEVDVESLKKVLRQVDKPFLHDIFQISIDDNMETIGCYFKNIAMRQYRSYTWDNSTFASSPKEKEKEKHEKIEQKKPKFKVTAEMVRRWGSKYSSEQISDLELFYNDMKMTHSIVTPQHEKALTLLSKMQLKLDMFLENDNMSDFQKLHTQYQSLLQSSGLRPIDKVGGDEATGMRSFSHIFEEVEKDGFIKPASVESNQDIVDKTIQYIMNYTLKLLNQQSLTSPPPDTPKVDDENG